MNGARTSSSGLPGFAFDDDRLQSFSETLDAIQRRAKDRMGTEDIAYFRRIDRISRACEIAGRGMLWFGPGPVSFLTGVGLLWGYKQLQTAEIGHTVLHGALNRIDGAERYHSANFDWRFPIDEESWIAGHNGRHHGLTNVHGEDPDIDLGHARLSDEIPHAARHYIQVPVTLLTFPIFAVVMNGHFTGLNEAFSRRTRRGDRLLYVLPDRSATSRRMAARRFLRKAVPYYAREFGLYPLLAGPRFIRVLLGNMFSEGLRDFYTAATIYCGHVGETTTSFPAGTRPSSKGERFEMQVRAANNFDVPRPLSILCGALDLQIEHHLFPSLPSNRLREVSAEVRQACRDHGVPYRSASWPRTLGRVLKRLCTLSFPTARDRRRTDRSQPPTTDSPSSTTDLRCRSRCG